MVGEAFFDSPAFYEFSATSPLTVTHFAPPHTNPLACLIIFAIYAHSWTIIRLLVSFPSETMMTAYYIYYLSLSKCTYCNRYSIMLFMKEEI